MLQSRSRAGFGLEAIYGLRARNEMAAQNLQRDRGAFRISRPIDLTHSSDGEQRFNLVFADALPRSKRTGLTLQQVCCEMNGRCGEG